MNCPQCNRPMGTLAANAYVLSKADAELLIGHDGVMVCAWCRVAWQTLAPKVERADG